MGVVPRSRRPDGTAALHKRALWFSVSCCILADSPHLQGMSRHTPCFRARWVVDPGRCLVDGGKSLAEPDLADEARAVMAEMKARGAEVPIPADVVTAKSFSADAQAEIKRAQDVAEDDLILDIGPETAQKLAAQLKAAGTIVWNGPVGVFELPAFENGTRCIAQAIASSSAFSIAGGGDTLAAIAKYGIGQNVGYISTGGGAFLEMLEGKTLPAIEILQKRATA